MPHRSARAPRGSPRGRVPRLRDRRLAVALCGRIVRRVDVDAVRHGDPPLRHREVRIGRGGALERAARLARIERVQQCEAVVECRLRGRVRRRHRMVRADESGAGAAAGDAATTGTAGAWRPAAGAVRTPGTPLRRAKHALRTPYAVDSGSPSRVYSNPPVRVPWARSSVGEHSLHTRGVVGSIPTVPTIRFLAL